MTTGKSIPAQLAGRGAGNGNFGIVTSFTYRVHPLKQVSLPGAGWSGDAITPSAQARVEEFSHALRPYVSGAYVNVPNPGMLDWKTACRGDHYARLREIKATYDPDNVFQYEQGIQPA